MPQMDSNGQTSSTRGRPALVVVDDHEQSRTVVANTLQRRFGSECEVVMCSR